LALVPQAALKRIENRGAVEQPVHQNQGGCIGDGTTIRFNYSI
jgi:hypothetical protein